MNSGEVTAAGTLRKVPRVVNIPLTSVKSSNGSLSDVSDLNMGISEMAIEEPSYVVAYDRSPK
jgi:hypothetical protein